MLQQWRDAGAITYAGYIIGFPGDTKASVLRDVEIIKHELAVDVLEFFYLTPLPGSEDHQKLAAAWVWMDPDMNKYDLNHRVSHHPTISDAEWEETYREAWRIYYTPEHIRAILRRAAAHPKGRVKTVLSTILWFVLMVRFEGVHPLEGGALRLKYRRDRRIGMARESIPVFYARYWGGTLVKLWKYWRVWREANVILKQVMKAPYRWSYQDLAITPPVDAERDDLDLYHATRGGEAALARQRRDEASRAKVSAPARAA